MVYDWRPPIDLYFKLPASANCWPFVHIYIYISLSLSRHHYLIYIYIHIHMHAIACIHKYNIYICITRVSKNHRAGLHRKPSSVGSSHRTLELEGCVIKVWPRWSQWLDSCPHTMTETAYWTVRIPIPFTSPIIFPCPVPISCTIWLD